MSLGSADNVKLVGSSNTGIITVGSSNPITIQGGASGTDNYIAMGGKSNFG